MKRYLGFVLSWALFLMGDLVSRLPDMGWEYEGRGGEMLYRIYSRLMCASCDIQDWGGKGPWNEP